ncbi:MAG: twin-arginine translocation signal domain-containing protein [Ignavibacteriales bacterium]|nr:twin-arginine translocation signal domain-containing protein [Ignavibacteriales bacterium]
MSEPVSRRDFIKVATASSGGVIGAVIGVPTIAYLIDPALRESAKEAWIPIGKLEDMPDRHAHPVLLHPRPGQRLGADSHQLTADTSSANRTTRTTCSSSTANARILPAP